MAVVIDDQLLLLFLAELAPPTVAVEMESGAIYTTSCWYYRLGRAVLSAGGTGSLSGRARRLPPDPYQRLTVSIRRLPDHVGLASPRVTVPVMAELRLRRPLNMLGAEALAVALLTEATILVTAESPTLAAGAAELGIPFQVVL